jgi:hypothetical protein
VAAGSQDRDIGIVDPGLGPTIKDEITKRTTPERETSC